MTDLSTCISFDFNPATRICHVQFSELVHLRTNDQFEDYSNYIYSVMQQIAATERIYLIINLHNLIIEPDLNEKYGALVKRMFEKYLYPDGVARYGSQITRVTVRMGHKKLNKPQPIIYTSENEAFAYIHTLMEKNIPVSAK